MPSQHHRHYAAAATTTTTTTTTTTLTPTLSLTLTLMLHAGFMIASKDINALTEIRWHYLMCEHTTPKTLALKASHVISPKKKARDRAIQKDKDFPAILDPECVCNLSAHGVRKGPCCVLGKCWLYNRGTPTRHTKLRPTLRPRPRPRPRSRSRYIHTSQN